MRAHVLRRLGRFGFPLPDALLALLFAAAAAVDFLPFGIPHAVQQARTELLFALVVEGGFLMMQATLVDIATRLKKRPPVWAVALIAAGVLLFSDHAREVLRYAWERGLVVFIPLLVSLAERATVLWHLPLRTRTQKIAARALIANRITTGLALLALFTAALIAGMMLPDRFDFWNGAWVPLAAGAVYFAVAAYDDWRVRGRRFEERPRVLFGFDLIHIEYLEPVG